MTITDTHDSALRALTALSRANRDLARAVDENDLLQRMCTTIARTGPYPLVWYRRLAQAEGPSLPIARAGDDAAVPADQHEFGSSICLTVLADGEDDGELLVHATEPDAFDPVTRELLDGLAADLGYGIARLHSAAALRQATDEAGQQRDRLQATLDSQLDPFILLEGVRDDSGVLVDLRYVDANAAAFAYNQTTREKLIGRRVLDIYPNQRGTVAIERYFHTIETGQPTVLDDYSYDNTAVGGERRYDIRAVRSGDGVALTWRDVTERYAAAQELTDAEQQLRLLAENATDVICVSARGGTIEWISPSASPTLGWSAQELIGGTWDDFVHPEDLAPLNSAVERSVLHDVPLHQRFRWRLPDGTCRWLEASARPVPGETSLVNRAVVTLRDVDDQVRTEADLEANEDTFRLLAENSSDVVVLRDEQMRILWASPSTATVLGVDASDTVGRSVTDFVDPDDVAGMTAQIEAAHASGTSLRYRIRVRTGAGGYRWFEGRNRPIDAGAGRPPNWVVSLQDIDDQVRAEQDLAASERQYRLLAENSSDVILLADDDTHVYWVSDAAEQTLGWRPDELVGRQARSFIHPDDLDLLQTEIERSALTGETIHPRSRWRRPDGTYRWMDEAGRPFTDENGETRRVVRLRDIDAQVRGEEELAASEEMFRLLAENSSDVIILADLQTTRALWASPSTERMLGWRPDDLIGRGPDELIHPDDLLMASAGFGGPWPESHDLRQSYRLRCADGGYRWVEAAARAVELEGGARLVVRLRDIDEQVHAQLERAASERSYRLLAENASDVVWQVSANGDLAWTSPSVERVLGWVPDDILDRRVMGLVHPDDQDAVMATRDSVVAGRTEEGEFRIRCADGSFRWMSVTIHVIGEASALSPRVVTLRDIEQEVASRERLEFALGHDQVTGLVTRGGMLRRIAHLTERLERDHLVGVLCVGVDALSEINEALTHAAGDLVMTTVAARIAQASRGPDVVGRGSGDEFIVLLPDLATGSDAAAVAERVRLAVHGDLVVSGQEIRPTVCVGIATGERGSDPEQLLRDASLALRKAKNAGRDRYEFADPGLSSEAQQRLALEAAIRDGLRLGEFASWFQPIIELSSGRLAGYESLVRWVRSDGVLTPVDFIPVAERSSLITDLDDHVLRMSLQSLATLPDPLFVSVNVAPGTLGRSPYAATVAAVLAETGADPTRLHLEVTETMLLDLSDAIPNAMQEIAALGVRWYVDDFGTGYSSISHLRDLPVAGLKLDRSFTRGIGEGDATSRQLAQALIGLANGLGLDTVAEGVETQGESDYLRSLGWRHGQGFLFGTAEPLD